MTSPMQQVHKVLNDRRTDLVRRLATEQDHIRALLIRLYGMDEPTALVIAHQHRLGGPVLAQLMTKARGA